MTRSRWINSSAMEIRRADPETHLFTAVLSQAVHDVFSTHVEKNDKRQAMDFLTQDSWHLRMVCELAGRNPDYVREKIRKRLLSDEDCNVDGCRKEYRNTYKGKKRGPKFKSHD